MQDHRCTKLILVHLCKGVWMNPTVIHHAAKGFCGVWIMIEKKVVFSNLKMVQKFCGMSRIILLYMPSIKKESPIVAQYRAPWMKFGCKHPFPSHPIRGKFQTRPRVILQVCQIFFGNNWVQNWVQNRVSCKKKNLLDFILNSTDAPTHLIKVAQYLLALYGRVGSLVAGLPGGLTLGLLPVWKATLMTSILVGKADNPYM